MGVKRRESSSNNKEADGEHGGHGGPESWSPVPGIKIESGGGVDAHGEEAALVPGLRLGADLLDVTSVSSGFLRVPPGSSTAAWWPKQQQVHTSWLPDCRARPISLPSTTGRPPAGGDKRTD